MCLGKSPKSFRRAMRLLPHFQSPVKLEGQYAALAKCVKGLKELTSPLLKGVILPSLLWKGTAQAKMAPKRTERCNESMSVCSRALDNKLAATQ
jgi:hypothetical protein